MLPHKRGLMKMHVKVEEKFRHNHASVLLELMLLFLDILAFYFNLIFRLEKEDQFTSYISHLGNLVICVVSYFYWPLIKRHWSVPWLFIILVTPSFLEDFFLWAVQVVNSVRVPKYLRSVFSSVWVWLIGWVSMNSSPSLVRKWGWKCMLHRRVFCCCRVGFF